MNLITHLTPETTSQELLDYIMAFLYRQGKVSYDVKEGICCYRGPERTMCAAGCVIPDEFYSRDMEGKAINVLLRRRPESNNKEAAQFWAALSRHTILINQLQIIHDNLDFFSNPDSFRDALISRLKGMLKTYPVHGTKKLVFNESLLEELKAEQQYNNTQ